MPRYDVLEGEVVDHYKRGYLMSIGENPQREIYDLMVEHKYGAGARDPMLVVDWGRVFGENMCPSCRDMLSLKERAYVCGKCGFAIPTELHGRAEERQRETAKYAQGDKIIVGKMRAAGYKENRISLLYDAAVEEAMAGIEAKRREELLASQGKGQGGRTGARLGRGGGNED